MTGERAVQLFRKCASSDDGRAWEQFVDYFDDRIRQGVSRILYRLEIAPHKEEVEDLVQEVYCRLLEGERRVLLNFRGTSQGEVMRYLQRVCESVVVDVVRLRNAVKRGGRAKTLPLVDGDEEGISSDTLADSRKSPESELLLRELHETLLTACLRLLGGGDHARNLEIFRLAVLEGWTSREISEKRARDLKAGSVDSLVHRQRRKLREHGLVLPHR